MVTLVLTQWLWQTGHASVLGECDIDLLGLRGLEAVCTLGTGDGAVLQVGTLNKRTIYLAPVINHISYS